MLLGMILDKEVYYVLLSGIEACYASTIYCVYFRQVHQRASGVKLKPVFYDGQFNVPAINTGKALLRRLQVYPCRWPMLSEIMWSTCTSLPCSSVTNYAALVLFIVHFNMELSHCFVCTKEEATISLLGWRAYPCRGNHRLK